MEHLGRVFEGFGEDDEERFVALVDRLILALGCGPEHA
jgi:hypothetical protein